MGVCERLVYLEHDFGRRRTSDQVEAAKSGDQAHAEFHADALRAVAADEISNAKPWCFIASATFSPMAPETQILRRFRDRVLRRFRAGRLFVRAYYWLSPSIARQITRRPWLRPIVARVLQPWVWLAAALCDREG
jgi:hypothetical protein